MPEYKSDDLKRLISEGIEIDSKHHDEQRTNVLIWTGDHYTERRRHTYERLRSNRSIPEEQRLRIVKNHSQKICKLFMNGLMEHCGSAKAAPHNKEELQDQKVAEMADAIWRDVAERHNWDELNDQLIQDFIVIGEAYLKVTFNYNKGTLLRTEEDEKGNPVPVMSGDFNFERIYGFDILRDKAAKSFRESRHVIYRKLVDIEELKARFPDSADNIEEAKEDTYVIFKGSMNKYTESKDQALVYEVYVRPNKQYPKGYFYIYSSNTILAEGEIPFGIFPIISVGFDPIPTSPRYNSIIKVLRPLQVEVNRAASKIAEHQITLGDDKVLVHEGTKVSVGNYLPGIRVLQYRGAPPIIEQGRTGAQYLEYLDRTIREMYELSGVAEDQQEKNQQKFDVMSQLVIAMRNKKKYVVHVKKYERFIKEIVQTVLQMAKQYYDDEMIVKAASRDERVNIREFKNAEPLQYQIDIEPVSEDLETRLAGIVKFNQLVQYGQNFMSPEAVGKLMRNLPYGNDEQIFESQLVDYDNSVNDILALDAGEKPIVNPYDDHKYMVRMVSGRMKKPDFRYLGQEIKVNYDNYLREHENFIEKEMQSQLQLEKGMIPMGGGLITINLSRPDGKGGTKRYKAPSQSVDWFIDALEMQGAMMADIETLPPRTREALTPKVSQQMGPQAPGGN